MHKVKSHDVFGQDFFFKIQGSIELTQNVIAGNITYEHGVTV